MNQQHFNAVFNRLTERRREVLLKLLANEKDEAIATSLYIKPTTVRKHRQEICEAFGLTNEFIDQRHSKFPELIALFAKYKPELLNQNTSYLPKTENLSQKKAISTNSNFVGREDAIAHLNNLVNEGAKVILIHAEGGIGKTTLAKKWFELQGLEYLELRVGSTPQNLNSVEDWLRVKLRDYFKENPEENFMIMLEQLKTQLQIRKIGVLIDNLEPALINGKLIEPQHSYYVEFLTVLAHHSVQSVTLITSREQIDEHTLKRLQTFQSYTMEGLKQEVWRQYFEICNINIDSDALSKMHQAYGGNAEVMYILSGDIVTTSKRDLKYFWKKNCDYLLINSTLENLVQYQFDKLQRDNPQVYKLLCRLGCYRYQHVPIIPEEGIFYLLWDEQNERDKLKLLMGLKNRALVKFSEEGCYLYEVIREEAIQRLKLTNDWKQCHTEAGIFLSTLISNSCQTIIPKINCIKVNDTQEQTYLNIENAEIAVKQGLSKQETIALEVVYHVMEFYGVGCFEELRQEPKVLDNPFFKAIENMVFEYVDCYSNLGLVLYKFALSTQVLGIIDEVEGNFIASSKEFEYYQRSLKVSQCFFQTALLMATKVQEDKLMIKLIQYLAECQDFTGIFLHQITKNNENTEAFDKIKVNLEKLVQGFDKLSFEQKFEEVKQAIHSLRINEQYYTKFIATFLT
ncbi:LuxR C-terminal-related transcriptional regulator [Nostoc punctiforme UO1]|uniref:LuxR C-terminal-related transcriptional regulator n=1 Tax=Nostoc punctiforme TaxID=272131 RepID=UPI0030B68C9D